MRGAYLGVKIRGVKIGRDRIGARHDLPDKHLPDGQDPGALRPDQVLLSSVIAGMAHSTLKSGAATRNASPRGHQLKIRWPRVQWLPDRIS